MRFAQVEKMLRRFWSIERVTQVYCRGADWGEASQACWRTGLCARVVVHSRRREPRSVELGLGISPRSVAVYKNHRRFDRSWNACLLERPVLGSWERASVCPGSTV
jgi:hypothetical protein